MKNILFVLVLLFALLENGSGQVTLGTGDHIVEIGGVVSTYFNVRPIKDGIDNQNQNKDRFKLRDARFFIEGRMKNTFEYKLQVDLSSLGTTFSDPESPALFDAYFKYKAFKPFNITMGYQKLPYSRSSMIPFTRSSYWQRPEFTRGEFFSRRDVGLTLDQSFWKQRINAYAGVYTGTGELFYQGDNDASGALEYVGRVDVSYPSRFRYHEFDAKATPIPMVAVGVNARYSKRNLPPGGSFIEGQTGEYGLKVVNGEKTVMGMDVAFQYKGFSALFETHQLKGTPQDPKDPLLRGLPAQLSDGYFKSAVWFTQASYFIMPLKTVISGRYEVMDLNDLEPGRSERLGASIGYQFNGSRSMIKVQYFNILKEDPMDPLRWKEQFRVGLQFAFE